MSQPPQEFSPKTINLSERTVGRQQQPLDILGGLSIAQIDYSMSPAWEVATPSGISASSRELKLG